MTVAEYAFFGDTKNKARLIEAAHRHKETGYPVTGLEFQAGDYYARKPSSVSHSGYDWVPQEQAVLKSGAPLDSAALSAIEESGFRLRRIKF